MDLFHCSTISGITELKPRVSKRFGGEKVVYLTSSLPMALMYAIRYFEYTYGYHWIDDKPAGIYYLEYFPNALKELYGGKTAYLYVCENGDYETTQKPNEYISRHPVKVLSESVIENVYREFIRMEEGGALEIIRYENATKKTLNWIRKAETEEILKHHLLEKDSDFAMYMKEKYPESWQDAKEQLSE